VHVVSVDRFADSELHLNLPELDPTATAVVVHSTSHPVQDNIMQLLLLIDALKARKVSKIIAVIPYFGYSRQCQADDGGPGHAQAIVHALEAVGVDAVVVVEPHSDKLHKLFSVPFYPVYVHDIIAQHCLHNIPNVHNCCIVAPDHGAQDRADKVAKIVGAPLVVFEKERFGINKIRITGASGGGVGECAIVIDDIIDTGSTILSVVDELHKLGVRQVYGYCVHPVVSGNLLERLQHKPFEKLWVSDTIALGDSARGLMEELCVVQAIVDVLRGIDGNKN
jgi:ribose-phosphate pyrophosphokinase